MKEPISCLIIDDNAAVLDKLKRSLERQTIFNLGSEKIRREVEVRLVRIDCCRDKNGMAAIDGGSLDDLAKALGESIDFIFADFAFILDRDANKAFQRAHKAGDPISMNDCRPFSAYLPDIGNGSPHLTQQLDSFKGRVLVYTNSPPPFDRFFVGTELKERRREFKALFPKASDDISIYNVYEKLKPDENVVETMSDVEREVLLANVLAERLNAMLMETTYCQLVIAQQLRRRKFSRTGIGWLTFVGVALGATTAFFGDIVYHHARGLSRANNLSNEIWALVGLVVAALGIGWGLAVAAARLIERLGEKLYKEDMN